MAAEPYALPLVITVNLPVLRSGEACADAKGVIDSKTGAQIADILALVDCLCLVVLR